MVRSLHIFYILHKAYNTSYIFRKNAKCDEQLKALNNKYFLPFSCRQTEIHSITLSNGELQ